MANILQLFRLKLGIRRWNAWRLENPSKRINLKGASFSGANLERVNLKEAHLEGASFSEANPEEAHLEGASFSEVNLNGVNLKGAHLKRANLEGVHLEEANLERANLEEVHLEGASFSKANLNGVNLKGANLEGARLRKVNLERANLEEVHLEGVSFSEANLEGARLRKVNLEGANLEGVNLKGANLEGANLEGASFSESNLKGANLKGVNLKGANLEGVHLEGVNLEGANLEGASFSESNLKGVNLKRAHLDEANLEEANLEGSQFSESNLKGVNLMEANLMEANFERANLMEANLMKANFEGANLMEANLEEANLEGVVLLWGAKLEGASLKGVNLKRANLQGANLRKVNLQGANLCDCDLVNVDARFTVLAGTTLTGACIQDWATGSVTELDNVICDYIFLKIDEEGSFIERRPHNGNFAPGEFVELYFAALETVDILFQGGIDWQAFLASFQQVQAEAQTDELAIQAIERKQDTFIVRLETPSTFDKKAIERSIKEKYDRELAITEARYKGELQAKDREVEIYRQQGANMMDIAKRLASRPITVEAKAMTGSKDYSGASIGGSIQDFSGAKIGGGVAGRDYTGDVIYGDNTEEIEKLKADIAVLWKEVAGDRPIETPGQQAALVVEIANNPDWRQRFVAAFKAGGIELLKEAINNPAVNVLASAIEGWKEG